MANKPIHEVVRDLINSTREALDLRITQGMDNCEPLKLAVANELASRLDPIEISAMGLGNEDVRLFEDDWAAIWAHLVIGRRFPAWFTKAVVEGKVYAVGRDVPDGFGKLNVPVIDEPGDASNFYLGDPEGWEDHDDLQWVNPHKLAEEVVRENPIGPSELVAFMMLHGFEKSSDNKVWTLAMGWDEDLVVKITSKGIWINGHQFRPWIALGGELVGNPIKGELPWKAAYWAIQYFLTTEFEGKTRARLRHLTEALVHNTEGPIYKGAARVKLNHTMGMLSVFASYDGKISVCNHQSVPADYDTGRDALAETIAVLNKLGIPWGMQHQGQALYVGPGAQIMGMIKKGKKLIYAMGIDKSTKVFQRTSSLMVKATCNCEPVFTPDPSNPWI